MTSKLSSGPKHRDIYVIMYNQGLIQGFRFGREVGQFYISLCWGGGGGGGGGGGEMVSTDIYSATGL